MFVNFSDAPVPEEKKLYIPCGKCEPMVLSLRVTTGHWTDRGERGIAKGRDFRYHLSVCFFISFGSLSVCRFVVGTTVGTSDFDKVS